MHRRYSSSVRYEKKGGILVEDHPREKRSYNYAIASRSDGRLRLNDVLNKFFQRHGVPSTGSPFQGKQFTIHFR